MRNCETCPSRIQKFVHSLLSSISVKPHCVMNPSALAQSPTVEGEINLYGIGTNSQPCFEVSHSQYIHRSSFHGQHPCKPLEHLGSGDNLHCPDPLLASGRLCKHHLFDFICSFSLKGCKKRRHQKKCLSKPFSFLVWLLSEAYIKLHQPT